MSKYAPFERVTASRLNPGDKILVRDGKQDDRLGLKPGTYEVKTVEPVRWGIQRTPSYVLGLADGDFRQATRVVPSLKLNRVTK